MIWCDGGKCCIKSWGMDILHFSRPTKPVLNQICRSCQPCQLPNGTLSVESYCKPSQLGRRTSYTWNQEIGINEWNTFSSSVLWNLYSSSSCASLPSNCDPWIQVVQFGSSKRYFLPFFFVSFIHFHFSQGFFYPFHRILLLLIVPIEVYFWN